MRGRMILSTGSIAAALALAGCASKPAGSDQVMTAAMQRAMTPAQVIDELKAGNARFVSGRNVNRDWLAQAEATAREGQFPKAIILSCLDARVPVEILFDKDIGDVFVGRVAGNFENVDLLGSFEFGAKVAGAKAIVVLGHTKCGAVMGAIDEAKLGNLTETLANIQPAVVAAGRESGRKPSSDAAFTQAVVVENVRETVRDIRRRSPVLAEMERQGELAIVGAWYDLATGKVTWLD